jgi:hypothetical protein
MFDIENSIAEWRRQLAAAGLNAPAPLEELEIHLREEIERQMGAGLKEQQAFETAAQQIGQPEAVENEFNKIGETTMKEHWKRIVIIGNGIGNILIGLALIMPALAQYRHAGAMTNESVVALMIGIFLALGGGSTAFCGARLRQA